MSASYPGANAQVVADTVAAPIEQQVNGVEDMLYMSSQCTNDGTYTLTVTFKNGVDLNMAQVLVQNRVALAQPILPDLVQRRGVTVKKKSPSVLMIVNLFSPDGTRDNLYLSNYATIQLKDELSRLPGVGDITYLGQRDYSMRLWLDPEKMASRNLSATDVVQAIEQQNTQVAAGQIGQPPVDTGQVFQFTISTMGRLADPEQFAEMILKTDADGRLVRLRDVARIELGAQGYDQTCTLDGQPSVALSIYQLPGSNALDIAQAGASQDGGAQRPLSRTASTTAIVYDTTPFITESINEVFKALRDAVILVAIVVLVFLQNWRSAIIPLVAVPVAIIGTFAVMAGMGFSLNNLTLFGLVLAIGIVVDDAIVVVEAVEHHIEHGLSPRDATIQAMEQVSGPVIAVGLVLSAVFVPCAFITRHHGAVLPAVRLDDRRVDVDFDVQLADAQPGADGPVVAAARQGRGAAAALAGLRGGRRLAGLGVSGRLAGGREITCPTFPAEALPWVAAALGAVGGSVVSWPLNRVLGLAFRAFNQAFDFTGMIYTWSVGRLLRVSLLVLVVYGGLLHLTYTSFLATPKGFIPTQDKGYLLVNLQLPDSASLGRTEEVMERIGKAGTGDQGREPHGGHLRPVDPAERQCAELRRDVRHARRFSPPPGAGAVGRRAGRRLAAPPAGRNQRRAGERARRAAARRAGHRRRLQDHDRGSRQLGPPVAASRGRRNRRCRRPIARPEGLLLPASAPRPPGFISTSTAPRPRPRASRWPTCSIRCKFIWARCTSTTSTSSAAPGK